ncbi:MATE family efflux transporter [Clostridium botulinum]|uniref:MATE family efflux transporter n=1 Tax=Clostridium botulinum TaxID=1491 RepID=UPI0013F02101|nr:MATE family efflux transporter [Clostridium botulinum]MCS6109822.1 MATE family efflux transporter [Clostridium botulinum]NFE13156.1 MATE family efflux transporter [Clostridium botulinum]NFL40606.1 MATE family efflux transporter [Clostridium botulinum]NFN23177.1 MATE family efflux transporter [Clostridium botulinum]NFN41872.1 MATE family efflux transporter [Clostridium botulinum]
MNKNTTDKITTDLGKDPIGKLLFSLALPAIVAQLVNILYNIVDRIFIGRIANGDIAMAGVGVAFPIILIISAFSALIGMGGAPIAAIKMGEKDNDGAEKILSNSFSTLTILGIALTIGFFIFKEPLLWAFGASEATIGFANDYLGIYLVGTIAVQIALGMNPFINTQGFAKVGMTTVMIGAVINIVLDPILIFGFDMGVKGAALATIISQTVSAAWVLYFLCGKKSILKIRNKYLVPDAKIVLSIMALGVSPFIMQATESLVLISQNNQLSLYGGDLAVGAMTIMSSIMQIILLPLMGLSQGAQPIISYNYGAKNVDRVKKTFKLLLISCLSYTVIMWLLIMVFPQVFVKLFNSDPKLIEMTSWSMRIFFAGIIIFGAQIACQQTFLALGQAKISLILALLRKVILLIPLIFIFPMFFENKLRGVLMAEPVADIVAALSTITCFIILSRKLFKIKE